MLCSKSPQQYLYTIEERDGSLHIEKEQFTPQSNLLNGPPRPVLEKMEDLASVYCTERVQADESSHESAHICEIGSFIFLCFNEVRQVGFLSIA